MQRSICNFEHFDFQPHMEGALDGQMPHLRVYCFKSFFVSFQNTDSVVKQKPASAQFLQPIFGQPLGHESDILSTKKQLNILNSLAFVYATHHVYDRSNSPSAWCEIPLSRRVWRWREVRGWCLLRRDAVTSLDEEWKKSPHTLWIPCVICDMWYVICAMWYVICDMWKSEDETRLVNLLY